MPRTPRPSAVRAHGAARRLRRARQARPFISRGPPSFSAAPACSFGSADSTRSARWTASSSNSGWRPARLPCWPRAAATSASNCCRTTPRRRCATSSSAPGLRSGSMTARSSTGSSPAGSSRAVSMPWRSLVPAPAPRLPALITTSPSTGRTWSGWQPLAQPRAVRSSSSRWPRCAGSPASIRSSAGWLPGRRSPTRSARFRPPRTAAPWLRSGSSGSPSPCICPAGLRPGRPGPAVA